MSCVVNLTAPSERFYIAAVRRAAARQVFLGTLLEINHACVHPKSHYYVAEIGNGADLYLWALMNDLITDADRRVYHGF